MRIGVILLAVIGLGACAGAARDPALENRVQELEAQLEEVRQRQALPISEDPLFDTYKTLQNINNSVANQVSALSYVQGNYGPSVNVYPLDRKAADPRDVLRERTEQYPRHLMQIGQDVYTENYNENILLYPVDDPYSALRAVEIEPIAAERKETPASGYSGQLLTRPDTQSTGSRRLTGYE